MSHAPLPTFAPWWLKKNGDRSYIDPVPTKIGWANPQTGEQIVAFKPGTFEALGIPVSPVYKPNAMGSSFLDENGNAQPTITTDIGTGFTVHWVAPAGVTVTGYTVDVADITVPASPVEVSGSPFAVASGTTSEVVTGLTTNTLYKVIVSYTTAGGTTSYLEVDHKTTNVA